MKNLAIKLKDYLFFLVIIYGLLVLSSCNNQCPAKQLDIKISRTDVEVSSEDSIAINFVAKDKHGEPLLKSTLLTTLTIDEVSSVISLEEEEEGGIYKGYIKSTIAGIGQIEIVDLSCEISDTASIVFTPAEANRIEIFSKHPRMLQPFNSTLITARILDQFNNILPPAKTALDFSSSLGTLGDITINDEGEYLVNLSSNNIGDATVLVTDPVSGLKESMTVSFPAIYMGCDPDPPIINIGKEDGTVFFLPIMLTAPNNEILGGYDLEITYDYTNLEYIDLFDPISDDGYPEPNVLMSKPGVLKVSYLEGVEHNEMINQTIPVANIQFRTIDDGIENIRVTGTLLNESLQKELITETTFVCTLQKKEKEINKICVNVIVQKDAFKDLATAKTEIEKDIKKAQEIFDDLTGECCPLIQLDFDKDKNVKEKQSGLGKDNNDSPSSKTLVSIAKKNMGEYDKSCINIYYFKELPKREKDFDRGITDKSVKTDCNKKDFDATVEYIKELKKQIKELEPLAEDFPKAKAALKILKDMLDVAINSPSISISAEKKLSSTVAHEIGHLFGLPHLKKKGNLMKGNKREDSDISLDKDQCSCFTDGKKKYEAGTLPLKDIE